MPLLQYLAIAIFFLWLFVDAIVVFRHKTGEAENRDRSSFRVLTRIGPLLWLLAIGLSFTRFGALHWPLVQGVGLGVMAIGIAIRSIAIHQLGRFHTPNVAIRADHRLLDTGLYSLVRHPSYLGAIVAFSGFGLALGNAISFALIALVTPCLYLYRIREEDAALLAAFGEPYRDYCARTKRLIPGIY
jgi:protein-S-isoprenylcysteine O-methyltransferase